MARPEILVSIRKVIPLDGRTRAGRISNPPDVPPIETKEFKFPGQEKPSSKWVWDDDDWENGHVPSVRTVQARAPLTPFFQTSIGGGRVGGGGTSKEALRRAKRKSKERFRRHEAPNQEQE